MSDDELRGWLRNVGGNTPQLLDDDAVWRKFALCSVIQASDLSTTRRRGRMTNPTASFGQLMVLSVRFRCCFAQVTSYPA